MADEHPEPRPRPIVTYPPGPVATDWREPDPRPVLVFGPPPPPPPPSAAAVPAFRDAAPVTSDEARALLARVRRPTALPRIPLQSVRESLTT